MALQEQVRREPSKADLRVFLFQLLAVLGEWERALTQLNVAAELDAKTLAMAQMYRETLRCERLRADVFSGRRSPVVFGEPDEWIALLVESLLVTGTPRAGESESLRARAFEAAPASAGSIDGAAFDWIADADMRLGPVCEAIINGQYYWVPFGRFSKVVLEAPADLRDLVWMPAQFHFANGGEAVGVIPTRYPGSEASTDPLIRLGRRTDWIEAAPGVYSGLGQRVFTTDGGDHPLLDVRTILVGEQPSA
jgi:type VI secretion system protein ImpE